MQIAIRRTSKVDVVILGTYSSQVRLGSSINMRVKLEGGTGMSEGNGKANRQKTGNLNGPSYETHSYWYESSFDEGIEEIDSRTALA